MAAVTASQSMLKTEPQNQTRLGYVVFQAASLPRLHEVSLDGQVLGFW